MMKNKSCRCYFRVAGFALLVWSLLLFTSWSFEPRNNSTNSGIQYPAQRAFYAEPSNSIDLFLLGDSSAYAGFSPMELWHATGMTSWIAGEPNETMSGANAMLKEVLCVQKPKTVFLETNMLFASNETASMAVMDGLKTLFSVFRYHNRWKSLQPLDLFRQKQATYHNGWKGQSPNTKVYPYDGGDWMQTSAGTASISSTVLSEFEMMLDTCRLQNICVVLIGIPNGKSWDMAKHHAVQKLADSHGLAFVDLNIDPASRIGFDTAVDFTDANGEHLNCSGAKKTTAYLASWLQQNNPLPDHRQDFAYSQWNTDYQQYYGNCGLYHS